MEITSKILQGIFYIIGWYFATQFINSRIRYMPVVWLILLIVGVLSDHYFGQHLYYIITGFPTLILFAYYKFIADEDNDANETEEE